jgi:hypothetical protein
MGSHRAVLLATAFIVAIGLRTEAQTSPLA